MTQGYSPQNPNRNLDYLFYFLFRTYRWQEGEYLREPPLAFGKLHDLGIPIDTDKRLFRRSAPAQTPLANWGEHFIPAWQDILQYYSRAFNPKRPHLAMAEAVQYAQANLLGVALVIMDETVVQHEVTLPLYDSEFHPLGNAYFNCDPQIRLFSISDQEKTMSAPAIFHPFKASVNHAFLKKENWSLRLDKSHPYLMTMQARFSEHNPVVNLVPENNPVFAVYGLAHGDAESVLASAVEQAQCWPVRLQNLLLGEEVKGLSLKSTALLNSIVARLLIAETVFESLDCELRLLRLALQKETTHYFSTPDQTILETPDFVLEQQLREMENLVTTTDYALGRLNQAVKTLEINQDNFQWRLHHLHPEELAWEMDWESAKPYSSLLAPLSLGIENLKNHQAYIEGKLTHLKGSCTRWRSYITQNRHQLTEHLGHVGTIIVFLIALGEFFGRSTTAEIGFLAEILQSIAFVLNHQLTYFIILILYVFFVLRHYCKKCLKYFKYLFPKKIINALKYKYRQKFSKK
jgi:hypothetical protein